MQESLTGNKEQRANKQKSRRLTQRKQRHGGGGPVAVVVVVVVVATTLRCFVVLRFIKYAIEQTSATNSIGES